MFILSLETSCDETSAAVVKLENNKIKIVSNVTTSQAKIHRQYGGVVPEVAARRHAENIIPCIEQALARAFLPVSEQQPKGLYTKFVQPDQVNLVKLNKKIDAIAVTYGPGLQVALAVGLSIGKILSYAWGKPLVPINHIEAHIYSGLGRSEVNQITKLAFPVLALIVSGGHTDLVLVKEFGQYQYLGRTQDDAAGEAFDKAARLLGLPYPGGPSISELAEQGNARAFKMPRPMLNSGDYNFSFSGLKTHLLYFLNKSKKRSNLFKKDKKADICASFQQAIVDVLVAKTVRAAKEYEVGAVILAGGVAANKQFRRDLKESLAEATARAEFFPAPLSLCGDNAAMIGIVGAWRFKQGERGDIFKIKTEPKLKLI